MDDILILVVDDEKPIVNIYIIINLPTANNPSDEKTGSVSSVSRKDCRRIPYRTIVIDMIEKHDERQQPGFRNCPSKQKRISATPPGKPEIPLN